MSMPDLCNCTYTWVGAYPNRNSMRIPNYLCDKPYTHNFEYGNKKHSCFPTPNTFSWYDHITESEIELMKKYKHSIFYFNGEQHFRADNHMQWIGEEYSDWRLIKNA